MTNLTALVLAAILSWSPARNHPDETADAWATRAHEIADDIVAVVGHEPAIWESDSDHSHTAILIASLAFWETNFAAWTDSGLCNDPAKLRAAKLGWAGACDGGIAVSMWQIHPEFGFVLIPNGGWRWATSSDPEADVYSRKDLLRSRLAAIHVALHLARQSIQNGAGLCQYSGEIGPCPKGDLRLDFAKRWWAAHPLIAD